MGDIFTMCPTAVHYIRNLTLNVPASSEVELWNKTMKETLNLKITKCHATVIMLSKLRQRNQGINEMLSSDPRLGVLFCTIKYLMLRLMNKKLGKSSMTNLNIFRIDGDTIV